MKKATYLENFVQFIFIVLKIEQYIKSLTNCVKMIDCITKKAYQNNDRLYLEYGLRLLLCTVTLFSDHPSDFYNSEILSDSFLIVYKP